MAILTDVVTYEGDDAGFFLKPVTENPTITDLGFEIIDDTVNTKFIYLNTEIDKITKKRVACGWTSTGTGATIYRKEITPVNLEMYLEQCADVFDETVFRKQLKRGVDVNDLTGTEVENLLLGFVNPVITRDAMRMLFLGDTASTNPYYNPIDGIYKKLAAGAITDGIVDLGALSDTSINTTNIIATLRSIVNGADRKLKQIPAAQKVLIVTGSVYDAYKAWLQDNAQLESARQLTVSGVDSLTFDGIPMLPVWIVDEYLEADFQTGSPSSVPDPHRIIYTKMDNHVLVLDTVSRYNEVKFWYDINSDQNKVAARYMMQYEYKYPELITIAGF